MKTLSKLLLTAALVTGLTACGEARQNNYTNGDVATEYTETETPYKSTDGDVSDGDVDHDKPETETETVDGDTDLENDTIEYEIEIDKPEHETVDGDYEDGDAEYEVDIEPTYCMNGWAGTFNPEPENKSLEDALIELDCRNNGYQTATTDSEGNYEICNLAEDECELTVLADNHITYEAGTLIIDDEHKTTDLETQLIGEEYLEFVREILHYNGRIVKWTQLPIWDIYTIEDEYQNELPKEKIDEMVSTMQNEISDWHNLPENKEPSINIYSEIPPRGQPENGHIRIYWDDSMAGAGNHSYINEEKNKILSAFSLFDTSKTKGTFMQELGANLFGSGESNEFPSVFNDPHYSDAWTPHDLMLSDIFYSRSAGTYFDNDIEKSPEGYVVNYK